METSPTEFGVNMPGGVQNAGIDIGVAPTTTAGPAAPDRIFWR